MAEQTPITLGAAGHRASKLAVRLTGAVGKAKAAVLCPPQGQHPASVYVDAFACLYVPAEELSSDLSELARRLNHAAGTADAPPARPLEALLADILAEGHQVIELAHGPVTGQWRCSSQISYRGQPDVGATADEWEAHRQAVETGDVYADTPTAAAEQRLAQVRALHAAKPAQDSAPGVAAPRYIVEQDAGAFYVVDTVAAAPRYIMGTADEVDARRAAGQLNAGQPLDLYPDEDDDEC